MVRVFLQDEAREAGIEVRVPRDLDAGIDMPALHDVHFQPGERLLIRTGVHLAIPAGWVGIIKDRSSVALKGVTTLAGVIDSSYRGEVKIVAINLSQDIVSFKAGERIAQCVVLPHYAGGEVQFVGSLDELGETERGAGGFGSTGR
ncbi:MAG: dUTP diphosphatase [bacterium]|nr:dUTP diphosphatase [bacterium]